MFRNKASPGTEGGSEKSEQRVWLTKGLGPQKEGTEREQRKLLFFPLCHARQAGWCSAFNRKYPPQAPSVNTRSPAGGAVLKVEPGWRKQVPGGGAWEVTSGPSSCCPGLLPCFLPGEHACRTSLRPRTKTLCPLFPRSWTEICLKP